VVKRLASSGALVLGVIATLLVAVSGCGSDSTAGFQPLPTGGGGAGGNGGTATGGMTTTSTTSSSGGQGGQPLGPPYPIVLAHGFFGFDDFAGAGFLNYYYGVKDDLAARGELQIYTPEVDPFNSSTVRGGQLIEAIEGILAQTGHGKVNIIGHSQGGLDARVVAHDRPDLVAAVVTVATPHYGSPIADIALGLVDDPLVDDVLDFLLDMVGQPVWNQVGEETDVALALHTFSTPGIAEFNATYPDAPGVFYASITGRTDRHEGGPICTAAMPPFVEQFSGELDPVDPLLAIAEMVLDGGIGNPYPNDGLVRVVDARWGEFLGCLPADHLDEVGQLLGDSPGIGNDWEHRQFYADLVAYLRDEGY
jgi:triacylglycerol lipase